MPLTRKDTQRQTRDRLIAAAHSSIIEEGVAAMSIRNICSAAGHSQGAFYSNFASKDDLLVEILQSHIQDEVTLLRDLVAHCSGDDIEATLQVLAARLANRAFRPYAATDVVGAEIGGAVKNVLAIACGVACDVPRGYRMPERHRSRVTPHVHASTSGPQ